jgi:hypothetical protein
MGYRAIARLQAPRALAGTCMHFPKFGADEGAASPSLAIADYRRA